MTTSAKTAPDIETATDVDAIARDLATLKHDLAALMAKMKVDAVNGATDTGEAILDRLGAGASHLRDSVVAQGERSAKAIGHQVEERPVLSLLVAFGVGALVGRLLFR
jgi:ElaB/YqjD/DUF883 family membrane-anchored ribosome-binding protein